MDELALDALDALAGRLLQDEAAVEKAPASFTIELSEQQWSAMPGCAEMTIIPLRLRTGRLAGLIAVCANARMQRRIDLAHRTEGLPRATMPLEMLAINLGSKLERRRWNDQAAQINQLHSPQPSPEDPAPQMALDQARLLVELVARV